MFQHLMDGFHNRDLRGLVAALEHLDSQLDLLIYDAFPLPKAS